LSGCGGKEEVEWGENREMTYEYSFLDVFRHHYEQRLSKVKDDEWLNVYYVCGSQSILLYEIAGEAVNHNVIILYGLDGQMNDCKIVAPMQSVHLIIKIEKKKKDTEYKPLKIEGFRPQEKSE
jgi:hypothetical protein